MQIEPEDILKIVIVCSLFSFAIGLLLGGWAGIGSEKARIKNMEKMSVRIVDYYFHMTEKIKEIKNYSNDFTPPLPDKKVPRFPPGPLAELYNEKQIEEVLTSVNKSFPDRMKAAKAAKRKA